MSWPPGGYGQSPGADQDTVDYVKNLAGNGNIDERSSRVLPALRDGWGFEAPPFDCIGCGVRLTQRADTGWDDWCSMACRDRAKAGRRTMAA